MSDHDFVSMPRNELERSFGEFHRANPVIYGWLERFTRELIATGRRFSGIGLIWERMRWEIFMETRGDEFKLNNNHRAYYARLLMREHPEWAGFFRTRTTKAEGSL